VSQLSRFAVIMWPALVLACVFELLLMALTPLSTLAAILVGTGLGAMVALALDIVQRRLALRNVGPVAQLQHPELGRVMIFKRPWQSTFAARGALDACTVSGPGNDGVPTNVEVSLWRIVRDQQSLILSNAHQALTTIQGITDAGFSPSSFRPALLRLEPPNAFTLFMTRSSAGREEPAGAYVRFKDMLVYGAGPTPLRE
jgi:hypothetical protein